MSTQLKPAPIQAKTWTPPEVMVGDVVHWYPDDAIDQKPFAAVVSAMGMRAVTLSIFNPQSYNLMVRDGVRHRNDPGLRTEDMVEAGVWEHTPRTLRQMEQLSKG